MVAEEPLSVLFVMKHKGFVRNFDRALRLMAGRGHRVHLAFEVPRAYTGAAEALCADFPGLVTQGPAPVREDRYRALAWSLRGGIDYLRYLGPRYRDAAKLRRRARGSAPRWLVRVAGWPGLRSPGGLAALNRLLRAVDRRVPTSAEIDAFLGSPRPDALIVTPLVHDASQEEYVRSARRLGLPSALWVTSWDNLTNKGLIRDAPDRVWLWNPIQREEAVELHGVPADRVEVTGAHTYDHWFDWGPSTERREFCARVGLPDERPFLLYLCSSKFIAPEEEAYVGSWVARVRASSHAAVREAGILVRPHPAVGHLWAGSGLAALDGVTVWPPTGADPTHDEARTGFYDSMYHSAAAVGVNTSALIEAAIVGRGSYTLLAPEFAETQRGTLHFDYLLRENGGPLSVAETFEEHADALAAVLEGRGRAEAWNRTFLERFVRPLGLDVPAAPRLVDSFEAFARRGVVPAEGERGAASPLAGAAVGLLADATRLAEERLTPKELRRVRKRVRRALRPKRVARRALAAAGALRIALTGGGTHTGAPRDGGGSGSEERERVGR